MLASPSLFIILPDVNEAIITPIVSTIEGVMLFTFKRYFLDIPYSEKKDHTKKICEIYMLLTRVGITQGIAPLEKICKISENIRFTVNVDREFCKKYRARPTLSSTLS